MGFSIIYSILDEKGKRSTTEVNLPSATAFNDVVIFGAELAKLIDPLITGSIERVGVAYTVALPAGLGIKTTPQPSSDVEEGARFQYQTNQGNYTGMRVPTFDEAAILPGSRLVDQVNTAVAAFLTAMESGIDLSGVGGSGVVQPSDKRDEDIVSTTSAREQFVSSR